MYCWLRPCSWWSSFGCSLRCRLLCYYFLRCWLCDLHRCFFHINFLNCLWSDLFRRFLLCSHFLCRGFCSRLFLCCHSFSPLALSHQNVNLIIYNSRII